MMAKIRYIFVILFGLVLLSNLSFSAYTIGVNGTNTPCAQIASANYNWTTIQAAINNATAGDTIYVCRNGTAGYKEFNSGVKVDKSINLYGNESGVNVITGLSTEPVFLVGSTYVNITNFTVSGATGTESIRLNQSSGYVKLWNVTARDGGFGIYVNSSNNNISSVIVYNHTSPAFKLEFSNNTILSSNIAYNVSDAAFSVISSHYNNFTNNEAYNVSAIGGGHGFLLDLSNNNILTSNIVHNVSNYSFYIRISSNNTVFTSNTAYGSQHGFRIDSLSVNNTLLSNTAHNNTISGFYLESATNNNLTSNYAYDNPAGAQGQGHGFLLNSATSNTLTSNTASNNGDSGFYLTSATSNTLTSNTASANICGFNLFSGDNNNTLTSNIAYDNSRWGVFLSGANNNTITNNTMYRHTSVAFPAFIFINALDTYVYNNTAYDNAVAFSFATNSIISAFEGNNATNATVYSLKLTNLNGSTLTFSGNNGIYRTPFTGYEVYLSNSTISTGIYNITTSNTSFGLNTTSNVTVKSVDLNDLSLTSVNILYSSAGAGDRIYTTSAKIVKNIGVETYYGLNVTNTSATATFAPRLYYNNSDLSGTSSLGVGSSSTSGTWTYYEPTNRDTTLYYLHKTGLTSFSYFAPLAYNLLIQSDSASTSTSKSSVTVSYTFDCETGIVTVSVTSGGAEVSGIPVTLVGISPAYSSSGTTNSEGEVTFTVASSGTYKILTDGTSSYYSGSTSNFELTLCEEEAGEEIEEEELEWQPEVEEEQPEEEVEEEPEEVEEEEEPETVTAEEALNAITSAEEEITAAEGEQTAALAKLEEAQEAYEAGNYELAKELAEEALTLIEEPEAPTEELATTEEETQQADYSWVMYLLGVILLVVVLIAGYFLLKGKKRGYAK